MSNSTPNWPYGYQPTAGEWSAAFLGKQDWNAALDAVVAQGGPVSWLSPVAWTPADASGATLAFTSAIGTACVVGNIVYMAFSLVYPTTANGSAAKISGMPYPPSGLAYGLTPNLISALSGAYYAGRVSVSPLVLNIEALAGGTVTNATLSTKTVRGQIVYALS